MLSRAVLIGAILASASAVSARELGPQDVARLEQGRVLVDLRSERDRTEHVWAAADIDASPEAVWAVMTDCREAVLYVPRLKSCQVLDADPAGRWDVRRHALATIPFWRDYRMTFRLDYDPPREMRFRQIAGDMNGSHGSWRLTALAGGQRTRVIYEADLRGPGGPAGAFFHAAIARDAPAALEALRARSRAAGTR
jgi:hypothetical protein